MSILNSAPLRQEITSDRVSQQLVIDARRSFEQMILAYEQGLNRFWKHPKFTPQEIADSLGTAAGELFRLHGLLAGTILAANPEVKITDVSTLGTFTINADGTVKADRVDK